MNIDRICTAKPVIFAQRMPSAHTFRSPGRAAGCIILALLAVRPLSAAPVTLPVDMFAGGGLWTDIDSSATYGLNIDDAEFSGLTDAYDNAFGIKVGGAVHNPGSGADRSEALVGADVLGTAITGAEQALSGLVVTQQFLFYHEPLNGAPTVRIFVRLANPTAAAISTTIELFGNVGSDGSTATAATSNGNTTVEADDRWVISDGDSSDPPNTIVYFGPGSPAVPPTAITGSGGGDDSFSATYNLTVPAGQTHSLLFFAQLSATTADALASVSMFNSNGALQFTRALCDLSQAQLDTVQNWDGLLSACVDVGDFVWKDVNNNGIQDAGEPGLGGIPVNLLNDTGTTVLQTTSTDANGRYTFDTVPAGNYVLEIVIPSGLGVVFSPNDQGADDSVDSDVLPTTGRAGVVVSSGDITTIDAGLFVSGLEDRDSDGVPDLLDNCISSANPDQADADIDGVGDTCDNCVNTPNTDQADADANGVGDVCDSAPPGGQPTPCGACGIGTPLGLFLSVVGLSRFRNRRRARAGRTGS